MTPARILALLVALVTAFALGVTLGEWVERERGRFDRWAAACLAAGGHPHFESNVGWRCYRSLDTLSVGDRP